MRMRHKVGEIDPRVQVYYKNFLLNLNEAKCLSQFLTNFWDKLYFKACPFSWYTDRHMLMLLWVWRLLITCQQHFFRIRKTTIQFLLSEINRWHDLCSIEPVVLNHGVSSFVMMCRQIIPNLINFWRMYWIIWLEFWYSNRLFAHFFILEICVDT
jgi:hypothetical protein